MKRVGEFFSKLLYLGNPSFPHKYPTCWNVGLTGIFLVLFYFVHSPDLSDTLLIIDISLPIILLLILLFWSLKPFFSYISWIISLFVPYHVVLTIMTIKEILFDGNTEKIAPKIVAIAPLFFPPIYFLYLLLIWVSIRTINKLTPSKSTEIEILAHDTPAGFLTVLRENAQLIQGTIILGGITTLVIFIVSLNDILYTVVLPFLIPGIAAIFLTPLLILSIVNFMMLTKLKEPNPSASSPSLH